MSIFDKINAKLDEWQEKLDEKQAEMDYNKTHDIKPPKKKSDWIFKVLDTIGVIILPILLLALGIGIIIGGGALIVWLFKVVIAVVCAIAGFIFNAFFYIIGFFIAIAIIGGFLRYWWFLVRWNHIFPRRKKW